MLPGRTLSLAVAGMLGATLATGNSRTAQQDMPAPSAAELALGDSVYHGKAGGALCHVCHGPAGKGVTGVGPNLTDREWLNGDGSVEAIVKVITEGVPKPKKMPAPMPPKGGGQLTEAQIRATAAYVHSLGQAKKGV